LVIGHREAFVRGRFWRADFQPGGSAAKAVPPIWESATQQVGKPAPQEGDSTENLEEEFGMGHREAGMVEGAGAEPPGKGFGTEGNEGKEEENRFLDDFSGLRPLRSVALGFPVHADSGRSGKYP